MSVEKVTPLLGLSCELLLLLLPPPREFLLMMPGKTNKTGHQLQLQHLALTSVSLPNYIG
jgi:hypothetical protein